MTICNFFPNFPSPSNFATFRHKNTFWILTHCYESWDFRFWRRLKGSSIYLKCIFKHLVSDESWRKFLHSRLKFIAWGDFVKLDFISSDVNIGHPNKKIAFWSTGSPFYIHVETCRNAYRNFLSVFIGFCQFWSDLDYRKHVTWFSTVFNLFKKVRSEEAN